VQVAQPVGDVAQHSSRNADRSGFLDLRMNHHVVSDLEVRAQEPQATPDRPLNRFDLHVRQDRNAPDDTTTEAIDPHRSRSSRYTSQGEIELRCVHSCPHDCTSTAEKASRIGRMSVDLRLF
jgi:hypothetical protein